VLWCDPPNHAAMSAQRPQADRRIQAVNATGAVWSGILNPDQVLEAQHQADTLRWLEATDDLFRRVKPATPDPHLVSYVAVLDLADGSSLLVDHINAGLWLPPGGHVESGEHPVETAGREAREELGIEPVFADELARPSFLTVTRTVGIDWGHVDVSLLVLAHRQAGHAHSDRPQRVHTGALVDTGRGARRGPPPL